MIRTTIPPLILVLLLTSCVSGEAQDERNADIFSEAKKLAYPLYKQGTNEHSGNINSLLAAINALPNNNENTLSTPITISGLVTIPSSFAFTIDDNICTGTSPEIYLRSFVLQDQNGGVLVAYGLHPADTNVANSNSMKYWAKAQNPNMAVFGDILQITVTKARKYGNTNVVAVVTDFTNPTVLSSRNTVPYQIQSGAFNRSTDLYQMRQLTGFVITSPTYKETTCTSGPYRFQTDHQQTYWGTLCVGAVSFTDAQNCTGSKIAYRFKLSTNLGAGTLTGFDIDNQFSYNLATGAYVRLTGPVIVPTYDGAGSDLTLLLDQKHQVETLTPPAN